jgi:hypothetical protein
VTHLSFLPFFLLFRFWRLGGFPSGGGRICSGGGCSLGLGYRGSCCILFFLFLKI